MKNLTEEQLKENYDRFIEAVDTIFDGERKDRLLHMYSEDELGVELTIAPASGKLHFHSAYVGGYIDHVMNVMHIANNMRKMFAHHGGIIDFTEEEMFFAAMHHDLGKLGTGDEPYYLPQTSEWHQKNKNEYFTHNPNLQYFDVTDRALWLLSKYGIMYSEKEMLGIMLADGLFNEARKKYWVSYSEDFQLKTQLPYIIHWADFMACRVEHSQYCQSIGVIPFTMSNGVTVENEDN